MRMRNHPHPGEVLRESRPELAAAIVALALALNCGCDRLSHDTAANPQAHLQDLTSVSAFQAAFDADSAHPRLVLLLSPT